MHIMHATMHKIVCKKSDIKCIPFLKCYNSFCDDDDIDDDDKCISDCIDINGCMSVEWNRRTRKNRFVAHHTDDHDEKLLNWCLLPLF